MLNRWPGIRVIFVAAALLIACRDKAKPDYDRCVQLEAAGDMNAAADACCSAVDMTVDPGSGIPTKSKAGLAAWSESQKLSTNLSFAPDEVDRIVLQGYGSPEMTFVRRGNVWTRASPLPERPAPAWILHMVLTDLRDHGRLENPQCESNKLLADVRAELAPEKAIHIVVRKGAVTAADVWFGNVKPSDTRTHARLGQGRIVWETSAMSIDTAVFALKDPDKYLVAPHPEDAVWKPDQAKPTSNVTCEAAADVEDFCQEHAYGHGYACTGGTVGDVKKAGIGCQYIDPVLSTHPDTAPNNRFCCEKPPE